MKRTGLAIIAAFVLAGGVAFAHGDAEHVKGTVTKVTDTAITVETTAKQTRIITINAKTMIMKGDAHLNVKDVKVGDRVVLEVDKKTSVATEVKLGAATPAPAAKASADHKHKG